VAQRSLNKVQLIGNLTRDPELRYTPQGTAVCTFGLATNRSWVTDSGEKREETEFHRIVAWNKLAELCSQLLFKGRRIYTEGRLQTRHWTGQDGAPRQTTEVVIDEMMILDSKRSPEEIEEAVSEEPATVKEGVPVGRGDALTTTSQSTSDSGKKSTKTKAKKKKVGEEKKPAEEEKEIKEAEDNQTVKPEDIPF